ncbi:MAG: hypothetical protein KA712_12760 [Myxococcales bacterium]|nr:hypothetical protein [Myxococcales bacterium]
MKFRPTHTSSRFGVIALALWVAPSFLAACTSDAGEEDVTEDDDRSGAPGGQGGSNPPLGGQAGGPAPLGGQAGSPAPSSGGQGAAPLPNALGPNDALAKLGCKAVGGAMPSGVSLVEVNAVADQSQVESTQAKIKLDSATSYLVRLPEGKAGWLGLDEDHWDATIVFFAESESPYEIQNAKMEPKSDGPLESGACKGLGITDYRVYFEHWSPAFVRFSAEGPREVMFMAMRDEKNSVSSQKEGGQSAEDAP